MSESRPVQVLENALAQGRLAHGILLHGDNLAALEKTCLDLAGKILETDSPLSQHPDFFTLRPQGKARFINVGAKGDRVGGDWAPNSMRRLINDLQLTPQAGARKVAVVYEADRMNTTAANAFLKTLEEPPLNTTLLLLTTRPYKLLATIRSRCLNFKLSSELGRIQNEDWQQWLADYTEWIHTLLNEKISRNNTANIVMTIYGLIARFDDILSTLTDSSWESYQETLPEDLAADQKTALEAGFRKSIRAQLFTEIETQTRNVALLDPKDIPARQLALAVKELERNMGLLEVNLNESVALESFFLQSLRIWSSR